MASVAFADVGLVHVFPNQLRQPVRCEGLEQVRQEYGLIVGFPDQGRPDFLKIAVDPHHGPLADRDHAVLPPLPLADDRSPVGVEVVDLEPDQLHAAHAGRVEGFEHGPVPDAHRVVQVGQLQHGFGLADGEHVLREPVFELKQVDLGRGVVQDAAPPSSVTSVTCSTTARRAAKASASARSTRAWFRSGPCSSGSPGTTIRHHFQAISNHKPAKRYDIQFGQLYDNN